MARMFSCHSSPSVASLHEAAQPLQPRREERRTRYDAELQDATREHEAELLAVFDRLPKWNTLEGRQLRHYYWNGQKWVEFDINDPPLWAVENLDPDSLAAPA